MAVYPNLGGTTNSTFLIGFNGFRLSSDGSGNAELKSPDLSSYVDLIIGNLLLTSNQITFNSDGAETGADWKLIIQQGASQASDLPLLADWLANRNDPIAHQRAIKDYQKSLNKGRKRRA